MRDAREFVELIFSPGRARAVHPIAIAASVVALPLLGVALLSDGALLFGAAACLVCTLLVRREGWRYVLLALPVLTLAGLAAGAMARWGSGLGGPDPLRYFARIAWSIAVVALVCSAAGVLRIFAGVHLVLAALRPVLRLRPAAVFWLLVIAARVFVFTLLLFTAVRRALAARGIAVNGAQRVRVATLVFFNRFARLADDIATALVVRGVTLEGSQLPLRRDDAAGPTLIYLVAVATAVFALRWID
jgi:hypothetical protein